jgi:hypothetical protein
MQAAKEGHVEATFDLAMCYLKVGGRGGLYKK